MKDNRMPNDAEILLPFCTSNLETILTLREIKETLIMLTYLCQMLTRIYKNSKNKFQHNFKVSFVKLSKFKI